MADENALDGLSYKPDQDQIAAYIIKAWKGTIAYFYGEWQRYEGGVWRPKDRIYVRERITAQMRTMRSKEVKVNAKEVAGVETILKGYCFVEDEKINPPLDALNMRNGILMLDEKKPVLKPHTNTLYFTWQLDFDFDPKPPRPDVFIDYLKTSLVNEQGEWDGEMMTLVQEMLGYLLIADRRKKMSFWLHGVSNSGKSQLVGLIREMLKPLHCTIDMNQLGENKFLLEGIVGKRVITFTEANSGSVLNDALFKSLVGGEDEIFIDRKNKTAISVKPQTALIWAMNDTPRVIDRSEAVYNRIRFILFPRAVPEKQRIENLLERMLMEKSGILWWMLEGLRQLRERGYFYLPERSKTALEHYRLYNDEERQFMQDALVASTEGKIPAGQLHAAYRAWRKDNGYSPKSIRSIVKDFERVGLHRIRSAMGYLIQGYKLRAEFATEYAEYIK